MHGTKLVHNGYMLNKYVGSLSTKTITKQPGIAQLKINQARWEPTARTSMKIHRGEMQHEMGL